MMTLLFTQGHSSISETWQMFYLFFNSHNYLEQYLSCSFQPRHDDRLVHGILYMLMLSLMTLTLMQGHSGSTTAKKSALNYLNN